VPKKRAIIQQNTFEGITVDVSDISEKLTERARRFVFWYCYPGTDAFQHKTRAAIRAGYAARNAKVAGYKLTKNPEVTREIERLSEAVVSERIDVMYNRYVDALETRAFYDPADFISGNTFKQIEEIAPEKDEFLKDWLPYQDMDSKAFESLWKSQKAKYENTPLPNANSPELEWAKLTAQTANIVVQTGHIKFDESLPMLLEGRKKAEDELREAMAGSKPYQPTDTTDMTPQEALRASQADYAKALKKGTNEEFEEAARRAERARVEAIAPRRNIFDEIPNIQNGITTVIPDFFKKGNRHEDNTAKNKMFSVFDMALRSGKEENLQDASVAFKKLQSVPQAVRERWDSTNAINPLADSNGVRELLTALNRLIEIEERNGTIKVNIID